MSTKDPISDINVVQDAFRQQVKKERSDLLRLGIPVVDFDQDISLVEPADFLEAVERELRRYPRLAKALQGQKRSFHVPKAFYELLMCRGLEFDPEGLELIASTENCLEQLETALPPDRWTTKLQQLADTSQFLQFHAELAVAACLCSTFPSATIELEPRIASGKRPDFRFHLERGQFFVEVKRYFDDFYAPGEVRSRPVLRRTVELISKLDGLNRGERRPAKSAVDQLPPGELNLLFIFDTQGGMERPVGLSTEQFPSNLSLALLGEHGLFVCSQSQRWSRVSIAYRCTLCKDGLVAESYVNPRADVPLDVGFRDLVTLGQPSDEYLRFWGGRNETA